VGDAFVFGLPLVFAKARKLSDFYLFLLGFLIRNRNPTLVVGYLLKEMRFREAELQGFG
jgi:hypothetical protein